MTQSQPPITRTTHTLPFDRLSPRDFERLCLWLVEREGFERAEHLGAAGSEQGRDIVAEDIAHYQRIVVALKETIRLTEEIGEVIGEHGGWPIE